MPLHILAHGAVIADSDIGNVFAIQDGKIGSPTTVILRSPNNNTVIPIQRIRTQLPPSEEHTLRRGLYFGVLFQKLCQLCDCLIDGTFDWHGSTSFHLSDLSVGVVPEIVEN